MIDVSKYTQHTQPGKFEGESAATEYFHEQMLNGDGEYYFPDETDDGMNDAPSCSVFQIDVEESEAFDLTLGYWFLLWEDSQGFAYGKAFATREQAESHFRIWAGIA
jgi:hypothetical protein